MRHFQEDEDARIANKKIYLNYSRSSSIEVRDGDNLNVFTPTTAGNGNLGAGSHGQSGPSGIGNGIGGGIANGGAMGVGGAELLAARAIHGSRNGGGVGGMEGNGKALQVIYIV